MTLSTLTKGWAVTQVAVLVLATTGAAFPLVASADESNQDNQQQQDGWHNDGNHDDNNQNDNQDENNNDNNEHDDGHNGNHTPPPTTATVIATTIVCDNEFDLPNWGPGSSATITVTTATDYVAAHPNCHLSSGWNFQWAPEGTDAPSDNTGTAGSPWATFGPSVADGTASAQIPATTSGVLTWLREVFQSGYVPFTYDYSSSTPNGNNVSAEFYCNTDHTNYDNLDWINGAQAGHTYYCVAFNALATPVTPVDPTCSETQHLDNHVCVDNTPVDPTCTETQHLDNHVCVDNTTTTTTTTSSSHGHSHGSNTPRGQVLGASCGLYMDKHIKLGSTKNDSGQVKKLQSFLNKWMGTSLAISGNYDAATYTTLRAFQLKYSDQILKPWGTTAPTGLVYLSTLRQINRMECSDIALPATELVPWNLNPDAQ